MQNNWYEVVYWMWEQNQELRVGTADICAIDEKAALDVMDIRLGDFDFCGVLMVDEVYRAE